MSTILRFSEANPVRMVVTSKTGLNTRLKENRFFSDYSAPYFESFFQPFEKTDALIIQFDSSFDTTNNVKLVRLSDSTDIQAGAATEKVDRTSYKVYEKSFDLSGLSEGLYQIVAEGSDADTETYTAKSEKIEVKADHCETITIQYYNNEVNFGIDYRTGLTFVMRIHGRFIKDSSGSEAEPFSDSSGDRVLINSKRNKARILETGNRTQELLPDWMIEKINLALIHDYCAIDDVRVSGENALSPEYIGRALWDNPTVNLPLHTGHHLNVYDSGARELL